MKGKNEFRGVAYWPDRKRCQARLTKDGVIFWGPFRKAAEAAVRDYGDLARAMHGEFDCVNFPREGERGVELAEAVRPAR